MQGPTSIQMEKDRDLPNSSAPTSPFAQRLQTFQEAIKDNIDFNLIRTLAFAGIPDSPGLRSIYWKLLLGYLPRERKSWPQFVEKTRKTYNEWVRELTVDPRKDQPVDDHPLSTANTSQWNAYFKDNEILEEIDKDVKRTLPGLHFFNHDKKIGDTIHYEALKRILFVYAKLNPGIKYVQGMNEILGPLYYIFATDPISDFKENAEADTFYCFTNLMSEIRDNFCKTLDKSVMGITGLMTKLNMVLKEKDPELWQDFENKNLNPQFYSFRWLTLLLSQEFELPDVLRLWDSLFADPERFEFFLYVCCAMIVCLRDELLGGTFADNLKLLQTYPLQDIHHILKKAEEIQGPSYEIPPPRPKVVPGHSPEPSFLQRFTGSSSKKSSERYAFKEEYDPIYEDDDTPVVFREEQTQFLPVPKPFEHIESDEDSSGHKSHPLA
eukprot:TRINITY_DN4500_c0_g1_i1.p1 TRINITY_DN4500_c0_g1~~TRINITY_DN4500_c0_g1_i1.p1  ORF type:complete len:438 (+),score=96.38 TRINITY_DN4500_c0_g1_i1:132-1445(+)